ncbi:podocalyxin precursor [Mus musculus]|uniref:Podocalyxin n=2 Tax=Mus musculus TaxID=10090 RepID=PODXL_MOUSE|nr:podocalyxin precursor [Mus musculus]Q9R0M4.2 RecName: Full=Podocalyxin; AltName: Full=Podocalyxin-like protein 1; Short=PC; Short=PCLP-1; Flags: Precursor [Mus musculus]AAG02458.1 podocalyxin [Mus musculus]AAH52442.1 Podocalyxin-like [Mus musculus]AAH54530.1 Podocalyxin-like [Mus musculus]AAL27890.1 podocalyxin [Mus musculus]EDL13712.1 podocalyxin-like [Mus musculus]|eukprot:NP_038751.2 podocalyxin precursor [Mus musculus]
MPPTTALSALLLLLLSPASHSHNGNETSTSAIKSSTVQSHQSATTSTEVTTGHPVASTLASTQPSNPTPFTTSTQSPSMPTSTPNPTSNQSGGNLTSSVSEVDKTKTSSPSSTAFTSSSGQTASSGGKSGDSFTTAPTTTLGLINVSSQPTDLNTTSKLLSTPTTDNTTSPQQPVDSSPSTASHPVGQHTPAAVPSSSGSTPSTDNSTLTWKPTTHKPLGTSEATQPLTSQTPGITTLPVSTLQQSMASTVGTTTEEFTHLISNGTPVAPPGPSTPSPIWAFGNYQLNCEPPIRPDEELLILNLTRASLCERSPLDEKEKLVELLCHSVKASFKPAEDLCTLHVAPILDNQAVAVKRIIIETKLSPKAVYELLKDRWDDLTEAGVSDMKLGKEGPPEVNEDRFSLPLIITIVCMASFLLLVAALYGCCHQRISQRKDQQRLTEELQTVENGYHDNPTLEVMETPSEMQEKKVVNLNGELGDSWIVPLDNLTKDDLDEEEDTHL